MNALEFVPKLRRSYYINLALPLVIAASCGGAWLLYLWLTHDFTHDHWESGEVLGNFILIMLIPYCVYKTKYLYNVGLERYVLNQLTFVELYCAKMNELARADPKE